MAKTGPFVLQGVEDDGVEVFALQFASGAFQTVVAFKGKADEPLMGLFRLAHSRQDVRVFDEVDRGRDIAAMPFFIGRLGRPEVRDRCAANAPIHARPKPLNNVVHLHRRLDVDALFDARGSVQVNRPCHQRHRRPLVGQHFGQGEPHFARAAVPKEPDRIQRLVGGSRGDENAFAHQRHLPFEPRGDMVGNGIGFSHASLAHQAARQWPRVGFDDVDAPLRKGCQIGLGGVMGEHVQIHGRSHGHWAAGTQENRQQQIVALTVHHGGEGVRRGRRNKDQISPNAQFDVVGPNSRMLIFSEI